jgi:hypothetical protein
MGSNPEGPTKAAGMLPPRCQHAARCGMKSATSQCLPVFLKIGLLPALGRLFSTGASNVQQTLKSVTVGSDQALVSGSLYGLHNSPLMADYLGATWRFKLVKMRKILFLPCQFAPSRQLVVEPHTLAFEDIHAVAVRLAARRLSDLQNSVADREARKLLQTVRAQRAEVKVQIQRIAFINEAAKLVGDDCFGFHLATETNTRELGIIHYILSASGTALDAVKNLASSRNRVGNF